MINVDWLLGQLTTLSEEISLSAIKTKSINLNSVLSSEAVCEKQWNLQKKLETFHKFKMYIVKPRM